ncbi:MAG: hypothetical protein ABI600_09880 [Luteolibacter sp.]
MHASPAVTGYIATPGSDQRSKEASAMVEDHIASDARFADLAKVRQARVMARE